MKRLFSFETCLKYLNLSTLLSVRRMLLKQGMDAWFMKSQGMTIREHAKIMGIKRIHEIPSGMFVEVYEATILDVEAALILVDEHLRGYGYDTSVLPEYKAPEQAL